MQVELYVNTVLSNLILISIFRWNGLHFDRVTI